MGAALTENIGAEDIGSCQPRPATADGGQNMSGSVRLESDMVEVKRLLHMIIRERTKEKKKAMVKKRNLKSAPLEARNQQLIMYQGSSWLRRKIHVVEKLTGPSESWRTRCGWHFGKGSKSELLGNFDSHDFSTSASMCTSGCFSSEQLAEARRRSANT